MAGQEVKKPDTNALNRAIKNEVGNEIQKAVNALLPSAGTTVDPFPRVTVTSFQHLPSQPLPLPTLNDKLLVWVGQYWSTVGLMGLALFSLVMLRSMVRAGPCPQAASCASAVRCHLVAGGVEPSNRPLVGNVRPKPNRKTSAAV